MVAEPRPTLQRTTFSISRELEFFTEKELRLQIGHGPELWPLALVKEQIDNGLDAAEAAGVPPAITVTVTPDTVSVADNGPGLPQATLTRSLDYRVRVSDKNHYVAPTRGQLGNALKCVWAAPFVRSGERGDVVVESNGIRSAIAVTLDRIAQQPRLTIATDEAPTVKSGTRITLAWPDVARTGGYGDHRFLPPAPAFPARAAARLCALQPARQLSPGRSRR